MSLLDGLLGEPQASAQHQQFADRFEQGGDAGISDEEALQHHERIARHASPAEYQQAALAAFQRMTPQQRKQFRQEINHRMGQRDHPHQSQSGGHEPGELAQLVAGLHSQNPGMLGSLMSGGGGMGGSIGKMALGGIAAMAVKQVMH